MEYHNKLYNLRKQKGLSQEELANRLNVSRQTISKYFLTIYQIALYNDTSFIRFKFMRAFNLTGRLKFSPYCGKPYKLT